MNSEQISKMFKDVFNNPSGEQCIKHLKATFADRPVYRQGQTFEQTAFREGQRDIVLQIIKEVSRDGRPTITDNTK